MKAPNTLLKVISILFIILGIVGIVLALLVAILGGAILASITESLGFGVAVGGVMTVILVGEAVFDLVAGILGIKGKITACKVLGFIILIGSVLGALLNISLFDSALSIVITVAITLILPVLYLIGAFKGLADT